MDIGSIDIEELKEDIRLAHPLDLPVGEILDALSQLQAENARLKSELEEARKDVDRLQNENAEMRRNHHTDVRASVIKERERLESTYRVSMVCSQQDGHLVALPILRTEPSSSGVVVIVHGTARQ